jgi:o-succinylbenzoate synthase
VKLEGVELYRLDLAFRRPLATAAGTHRRRPVAFLRVLTDGGDGWGECPALEGGTAVDPPFRAVWDALVAGGVPRLQAASTVRQGELPPASQVGSLFGGAVGAPVSATVEMAVLDAELRSQGVPLWRRLGVDPSDADAGAAVGSLVAIPQDRGLGTLVEAVAVAAASSERVRLKIEPGWDVEPVRAVRRAFPHLALQVDANGSYRVGSGTLDDVARLTELDNAGLVCIEQPLPPADLTALADAARLLETPVCLDESLTSLRRLRDALRYGACEVACIKPSRFGGLLGAAQAQQECLEAGVPAFVGGFFETGFARQGHAALSCLPGCTLPGDLSDPLAYLEADPVVYPVRHARIAPYDGPGIAPVPAVGRPSARWT